MRVIKQGSAEVFTVHGEVKHDTGRAILIIPSKEHHEDELEDEEVFKKGVWFPTSQVTQIHPDRIVVKLWIAKKNGFNI